MPSKADISAQQKLLATHRRTLMGYLNQQAKLSEAFAPPAVSDGIYEARANIQRIKGILRSWGAPAEDLPDDGDDDGGWQPAEVPSAVAPPDPKTGNRAKPQPAESPEIKKPEQLLHKAGVATADRPEVAAWLAANDLTYNPFGSGSIESDPLLLRSRIYPDQWDAIL